MYNYFENLISEVQKSSGRLDALLSKSKDLYTTSQANRLNESLLQLVACAEKLCNQIRLLPTYTGMPSSINAVKNTIIETNDALAEYTDDGWFHLSLPGLLPRKEKGDAKFIRTIAQSALSQYFNSHPKYVFRCPVVLVYQHVYEKSRKERAYRDHDNIEINVINDLLALYCLSDDGPMKCRHYYTSKQSDEDRTEIYIVPYYDFAKWLRNNEIIPDISDS